MALFHVFPDALVEVIQKLMPGFSEKTAFKFAETLYLFLCP